MYGNSPKKTIPLPMCATINARQGEIIYLKFVV